MFEQQPEALREKVKLLATESLQNSDPTGWFEVLYSEADGDSSQVPWARLTVHHSLQDWLDTYAIQGDGRSALVIGCGLGDDAEALSARGFQVTAFDISPTAIAWCKQRFPNSQVNYQVADLLALDPQWHRAFDFVLESRNIQALPLNVRGEAIASVASVLAEGGRLLTITRFRDNETEPDGPPWSLSDSELAQFQQLGLQEVRRDPFAEGDQDAVKHLRIEYIRPR